MKFKSPDDAPQKENQSEQKISTNNFWCFLPNGPYRNYQDANEERLKIMKTVDELLATPEFSDINPEEILANYRRADALSDKAIEEEDDLPKEEFDKLFSEAKELYQRNEEKNLRLFKKMLSMGFTRASLAS